LEWTSRPSTVTSKTPPLDSISVTSAAVAASIFAARLAARSRYPHWLQYSMLMRMMHLPGKSRPAQEA
jgi:hypothetical protein